MKDYEEIITLESGKRGGKPTIRGMRISVSDILSWLVSGRIFLKYWRKDLGIEFWSDVLYFQFNSEE